DPAPRGDRRGDAVLPLAGVARDPGGPRGQRHRRSQHRRGRPYRHRGERRAAMIPSTFDYEAPATVAEALTLLSDDTREVKVLAGGQSLLPVLKLRMADPELVVSLQKIDELRGVRIEGETLVIGAMTRHADVAREPLISAHAPLLARAATEIADPQVRHRGTIGGAVVHADPASDMPATLCALEAQLQVVGPAGQRPVPAADCFEDFFTPDVDEAGRLARSRG